MPYRLMVCFALVLLACAAVFSIDSESAAAPDKPKIVDRGLVKADDGAKTTSITVRLRSNASESALRRLVGDQGGITVKENSRSRLHVVSVPDKATAKKVIEALKQSPLVEDVAETRIATVLETPNDTNFAYQWHMHDTAGGLRVEPAWDLAPNKGSGVVVAVIDTGVAYEAFTRPATPGLPAMAFQKAPDLAGLSFVASKNYIFDDTHANDDHSHGSHVTGTIAQATNNAFGVAGVAENVTIMPIKVLDYTGAGADADLVDALYYAVDNGADVISMSLGFTGTGAPDANGNYCTEIVGLTDALDYANSHGVVVVAAAGNEAAANVSCPAAYPTVIAVGASTIAAQVASYSNHGNALDVVAPGGDPNADLNGDGFSDSVLQESYCNSGTFILLLGLLTGTAQFNSFCDVFMAGTSMATPHVSGVAALLLGENPSLSPSQVRSIIEGTARDGGAAGWDPAFGHGIVDAAAAVAEVSGAPTPTPSATSTPGTPPPPTSTLEATATPTNTPEPTAAPTNTPQPTATPTNTPQPTPTPPDTSPPSAPTDLVATSGFTIRLSWSGATDPETGVSTYRIYRGTASQGSKQLLAEIPGDDTSFVDEEVTLGTIYFYEVTAINGDGFEGDPSNEAEAGATLQLSGRWPFDETSGTNAPDDSGFGFDGTLVNGPTWASGRIGGGLNFDGSNDRVNLPAEALDGLSDLTISLWFKTTKTGQGVFLSGANSGNDNELLLFLYSSTAIRFYTGESSGVYLNWPLPYSVSDGQWHHVALVRDDDGGPDKVSLYLDGELVSTKNTTLSPLSIATNGFLIGQDQDSVGGGFQSSQAFQGTLDEVRLYASALDAPEIEELAAGP